MNHRNSSFRVVTASALSLFFPAVVSAQQTLASVIELVILYLNSILFLLMAVAIVMFVWYVIKYFIRADADKKDAGLYVMYSIIGFFVILSVWGIVNILSNTFGIGNSTAPTYQQINNLFPRGTGAISNPPSSGSSISAPNPGGIVPGSDDED